LQELQEFRSYRMGQILCSNDCIESIFAAWKQTAIRRSILNS